MTYFFSPSGKFLHSSVHTIPDGAVEITESENRGLRDALIRGATLQIKSGKVVVEEAEQVSPDLEEIKRSFKVLIDEDAETQRLKYITPGSGQAMTYRQKVDEAERFLTAGSPQADDYPMLAAEIGITADTMSGVAEIVLAAFSQWQIIGAAIEAIRLGAKRDLDAATDDAAARAVFTAITWPGVDL